jgi:hypothetical protein
VNHINTVLAVYGASLSTLLFIVAVVLVVVIGRRLPR